MSNRIDLSRYVQSLGTHKGHPYEASLCFLSRGNPLWLPAFANKFQLISLQTFFPFLRVDISWFWYYLVEAIAALSFTSSDNSVNLYWFSYISFGLLPIAKIDQQPTPGKKPRPFSTKSKLPKTIVYVLDQISILIYSF